MGPVNGLVCLDTRGKVIAWNPKEKIEGSSRPMRPMRAMRPLKPLTPLGGWSALSILEWINQ